MGNNYGDVGPYGADNPYGGSTSSSSCNCGLTWRYEATDIRTGRVKAVLQPIKIQWEEYLSKPGQGTLEISTRQYKMQQIFAHTTGLYVSIVHNHPNEITGVNEVTRECVFGGYIESHGTTTPQTTTVGIVTIDQYLFERALADADSGLAYAVADRDQNLIGAQLVSAAHWNGLPLTASWDESDYKRDRNWQPWELKNLGDAVEELVNELNGPDYEVLHYYTEGVGWNSVMHFADHIGVDRGVKLRSDFEGVAYQNQTDGKDHATRTYGVGQGEEAAQLLSVAYDSGASDIGYPEFHQVVAWKDVADQSTLDSFTRGNVVNHRDPVSSPGMTIAGYPDDEHPTIPSASRMRNGDRVYVDIQNGLNTFQGFARILSQQWIIEPEKPLLRTPAFLPEVRSGESVRVMPSLNPPTDAPDPPPSPTPGTPPPLASAEPKAGLVSQMSDARITESSGMTHSRKW
jgi:hypothetical protein